MNKNKSGLIVGLFLALVHAVWAVIIAVIPAQMQSFLDWVFKLHFIEPVWKLTTFNFLNAIFLVIVTFIAGYIFGWVFVWVYKLIGKKLK